MRGRVLGTFAAAPMALTLALTGCGSNESGSGAGASQAKPAGDKDGRQREVQAAIADCMKKKGHKYVPHVAAPPKLGNDQEKANEGDYTAMKTTRGKYGFGVFAAYVYPKEFLPDVAKADPNMAIQSSLSETQRKAYGEAFDACTREAMKKVLGKDVKSVFDSARQDEEKIKQALARELDGNAELVRLATAMADCLKGKGYRVGATNPTALAKRGFVEFAAQSRALEAANSSGDQPPELEEAPEDAMMISNNIKPEDARPYLEKEIKAALDDLECGKDFYAVYSPKQSEIMRKFQDESAGMGLVKMG